MAKDVLIDAQMTDKTLLESIDATLKRSEAKFDVFSSNINNILSKIGSNIGQNMATNFNSQISLMESKINELKRDMSSVSSMPSIASSPTNYININDLNNALVSNQPLERLEQMKKSVEEYRQKLTTNTEELRKTNDLYTSITIKIKEQTTAQSKIDLRRAYNMSDAGLTQAESKLKELQRLQQSMQGKTILSSSDMDKLNSKVEALTIKIAKLKYQTSGSPLKMTDVLGMSESSLNAVSLKMKAIGDLRGTFGKGSAELSKLNQEYLRLNEAQKSLLTQGVKLESNNNKLAASFSNLWRRVLFYTSLGAMTGFVRQMLDIRGQFEMTERSMGALLGNFQKGSEIFKEIQANALKSPFSILELTDSAKQLIAYNFAANEVVDTTKRLADISSALGVSMERLVYNTGQIKAKGFLDARDARDYANAGFGITRMLAEMYTEQKRLGDRAVTTSDVMDMMTKRLVSYKDVMNVINRATNEGGMFFDFQAKQASTLRGQLSNLTDAWNLMLNDMGKDQSGILTGSVSALRTLFLHWQDVLTAIKYVVLALGLYKSAAISAFLMTKIGSLESAAKAFFTMAGGITTAKNSMMAFNTIIAKNPIGVLLTILSAVNIGMDLFADKMDEVTEMSTKFGESSTNSILKVKTLSTELQGMTEGSSTYKKIMGELNTILQDYGLEIIKEGDNIDIINKKRTEAIELIKQEGIERQKANLLDTAYEKYISSISSAQKEAENKMKESRTVNIVGWASSNEELRKNSEVIASVMGSVIQENISLIANKSGEEYKKGFTVIIEKIRESMRKIGISEKTLNQTWTGGGLFFSSDLVQNYIASIKKAEEEHVNFVDKTNKMAEAETLAASSTLTYGQKISALYKSFQKPTEGVHDLYTNIKNLMSQYSKNNIGFDIKIGGEIPNWMMTMNLDDLQKFAKQFAALGSTYKGGANVNGTIFSQQELLQRSADYVTAAEKKQEQLDIYNAGAKEREKEAKKRLEEESKAIKEEIDLIGNLAGNYEKLAKAGISREDALAKIKDLYKKSIGDIRNELKKYNLPIFDINEYMGRDVSGQLDYLNKLRDAMKKANIDKLNPEAWKEVSIQIDKLSIDAAVYDVSKITEGLERKLSDIKESYELGVEIEADPEMGDLFKNIFKINPDSLIKTVDDAIKALQTEWDKSMGDYSKLNSKQPMGKIDILSTKPEDLAKTLGLDSGDAIIQKYKAFYDYARKIREDDFKSTTKAWDELLSKYAEYEYKRNDVQKTAAKERLSLIQKFGTNEEYKQALDLSNKIQISGDAQTINDLQQQLINLIDKVTKGKPQAIPIAAAITKKSATETTELDFTEFKNSDLYIKAFEDLGRVGKTTLDMLYEKLKVLSKDPTLDFPQFREIMRQMKNIRNELQSLDPFKTVIEGLKDWKKAQEDIDLLKQSDEVIKLSKAQQDLAEAEENYDKASIKGNTLEQKVSAYKELKKAKEEVAEAEKAGDVQRLTDAENRLKAAQDDVKNGITGIKNGFEAFSSLGTQAIGILKSLAEGFGITFSDDTTRVIENIGKAFEIVVGILGLLVAIEVIVATTSATLMTVLWPLLAVTVALAIAFTLFGAKNAKIDKEIKASELNVKKLQNAYKELENAVTNSLGTAETLAKKAEIANKKLQLAELQRQLALEKSRTGKKRDESKIADLEGQIIDLKNDIETITEDIVNTLLGSDIKSAAEDFSKTWIEAWKNGENTIDSLKSKFTDMIDTMIVKSLASAIVAKRLKNIYDLVDQYTDEQSEGGAAITEKELKSISVLGSKLTDSINQDLINLMDALGIKYGSSKTSNLSDLQQGIQNISETTAGALEAKANSIDTQGYVRNGLLQQLFNNSNVSLGVQSEILLQMQQSRQIQGAIQSILASWSSNNGRSVRVEMI